MTDNLKDYELLSHQAGLVDYSYRGKVKVSGEDCVRFLHNILTNDIESLEVSGSCEAALLNAQSKILMYMIVYKFQNFIILDVEGGMAQKTIQLLDRLLITENVELGDISNNWNHFSVQGPEAEQVLKKTFSVLPTLALCEHVTLDAVGTTLVLSYQRLGNLPRYDLWIPKEKTQAVLAGLSVGRVSDQTAELVRIEQGVLRHGMDMDESTMLSETGLDAVAVSETKGCYPGQEVVAKIKTYSGLQRKAIKILFSDFTPLKHGDKICNDKKEEVGWVTSVAFVPEQNKGFALGYAKKGYFDKTLNLTLESGKQIKSKPLGVC